MENELNEEQTELALKGFTSVSDAIMKASIIVVGYMFLTIIVGAFVDFGWAWLAITLSYIVAVGAGISYCVIKEQEYNNFIKHL